MEYPKPVMSITELIQMGYTEEYLRKLFRMRNQHIAFKMDPTKSRSKILFDTAELEKFRVRTCGTGRGII